MGFTLVEVLLAATIGAFVAAVAIGTLKSVTSAAEMVDKNIESGTELKYAAKIIATDLINIYRDRSRNFRKFIAMAEDTDSGIHSFLTFYTLGRTKARPGQIEGDVYEVEYYLAENDNGDNFLMRRLWPNPDKDTEPGGMLSAIAENISVFEVRYYDGSAWSMEWPEDMRTLPDLVEVTLAAEDENREGAIVQSFLVNIARCTGNAISEGEEEEETETDQTSGGQTSQSG
jgi:type II secretion system protein J